MLLSRAMGLCRSASCCEDQASWFGSDSRVMEWCRWDCSMQERCATMRNWKSATKMTNENHKKAKHRPFSLHKKSTKSNNVHFVGIDWELRDHSSEQVVLCMATKCERQREHERKAQTIILTRKWDSEHWNRFAGWFPRAYCCPNTLRSVSVKKSKTQKTPNQRKQKHKFKHQQTHK